MPRPQPPDGVQLANGQSASAIMHGVLAEVADRFPDALGPAALDTDAHLEKLLNRIIAQVMRRLVKDGLLIPDQEQAWLDLQETDSLDKLNAGSARYRVAIGPGAGARPLSLKSPGLQRKDTQPKPFTVDRDGFSLNAAVACQPHQRQRLERGLNHANVVLDVARSQVKEAASGWS